MRRQQTTNNIPFCIYCVEACCELSYFCVVDFGPQATVTSMKLLKYGGGGEGRASTREKNGKDACDKCRVLWFFLSLCVSPSRYECFFVSDLIYKYI
jgi:hypothetical protein